MIVETGWKPGEADRAVGHWGSHYGSGRNGEGSKWHRLTTAPRARHTRARDRAAWKRDQAVS